MMKLYYSGGSCSTSCHILLEESGLKYEAVELDWDKPADAELVKKLNPAGTLPILITENEQVLNQNLSIHAYIAERAPEAKLLPKAGTPEYFEALNWESFVATDLHKAFSVLFAVSGISPEKNVQDSVRSWGQAGVKRYLAILDKQLTGRDYLMGKTFTTADAYASVVTNWVQWVGLSLDEFPHVHAYLARIASRPAVKRVIEQEGLQGEMIGA